MPVLNHLEDRVRQTWERSRLHHSSILARFVAQVEGVGGIVRNTADPHAVGFSIGTLARAKGITLCQTADTAIADELDLHGALAETNVRLSAGSSPDAVGHAGIGITRAVLGVAETGSILTHLDEVDGRLLSMLPEIHIALLPRDALVDSLEEGLLMTRYLILKSHVLGRPSYLSWVTGPSRTADIERVLTIGVHGPRELHVFLLPGMGKEFVP